MEKIKKFILIKATYQKASYHVKKMNMQPQSGRKYLPDKELAYSK